MKSIKATNFLCIFSMRSTFSDAIVSEVQQILGVMILLAISAWWFWLGLATFLTLLIICEACESGLWSFVVLVAAGVTLHFSLDSPGLWGWMQNNYTTLLLCAVGYVVVGMPWAVFKWYLFLLDKRDEYQAHIKRSNLDGQMSCRKLYPPKVEDNKARLTRWMSLWPQSMIWTLFEDLLRRLYERLVQFMSGTLDRISRHVFREHLNDLGGEK